MTSLRDIRKHIRSVRKTQKMMRAMKMVSTQRLKRAVDALMGARPYADDMRRTVGHLAAQLDPQDTERFPLLHRMAVPHRVMLVVLTSDRGLAGTFNSNVCRVADRFLWEEQAGGGPPPATVTVERRRKRRFSEIQVVTIGRKGRDHFARQPDLELAGQYVGLFEEFSFDAIRRVAESIEEAYIRDELHAVFIAYNEFKNLLVRNVVVEQFLPIVPAGQSVMAGPVVARGEQLPHGAELPVTTGLLPPHYEPGVKQILEGLLPRHFATQLYRAALESRAAEHAARMTAMEAASANAAKMVDTLTLKLNRARQAMITKELMEIIGGAEAQK